jgi:penicillin-insensitive murein endopeptidase
MEEVKSGIKMKIILGIFLIFNSCFVLGQVDQKLKDSIAELKSQLGKMTIEQFQTLHLKDTLNSKSTGSHGDGQLQNGNLMPFRGDNFTYFDEVSYKSGRAFMNDKAKKAVIHAYGQLAKTIPDRHFYLMECSNEHGGEMFPHKTHQNGLSVDFMMPLLKDGKAFTGLDTIGADHYWLSFDNEGRFDNDKSITVDFNTIARHILILNKSAAKFGVKVKKVIIKIEFKDELFATEYGKQLKSSGIYVVQKLSPLINALHDEHYHIDFEGL